MVRLGTCGVDFTSHFLDDEAELLSGIRFGVDSVHEVSAVLAEPDFFLVDVELLQIEDHLLLEPDGVDLLGEFIEVLQKLGLHGPYPFSLECLDFVIKREDVPHS